MIDKKTEVSGEFQAKIIKVQDLSGLSSTRFFLPVIFPNCCKDYGRPAGQGPMKRAAILPSL